MDSHSHWNSIYTKNDSKKVSWFQEHADTSLRIIQQNENDKNAHIIDVGAGASPLVDDLLHAGYNNLEVLDISSEALNITQARLGDDQNKIVWHDANILNAELAKNYYDVWHDRAVFHFLTSEEDRARYVEQVSHALKPNGKVIISTFGPNGPLKETLIKSNKFWQRQVFKFEALISSIVILWFKSITKKLETWLSPYRAGLQGITSVVINFPKGATILKIYA